MAGSLVRSGGPGGDVGRDAQVGLREALAEAMRRRDTVAARERAAGGLTPTVMTRVRPPAAARYGHIRAARWERIGAAPCARVRVARWARSLTACRAPVRSARSVHWHDTPPAVDVNAAVPFGVPRPVGPS